MHKKVITKVPFGDSRVVYDSNRAVDFVSFVVHSQSPGSRENHVLQKLCRHRSTSQHTNSCVQQIQLSVRLPQTKLTIVLIFRRTSPFRSRLRKHLFFDVHFRRHSIYTLSFVCFFFLFHAQQQSMHLITQYREIKRELSSSSNSLRVTRGRKKTNKKKAKNQKIFLFCRRWCGWVENVM